MSVKILFAITVLGTCLLLLVAGSGALAQTSASYNLEWHVIGGGGQPVTSTHYMVNSTAGQGAASPPYSFSGNYVVSGGYWFGAGPTISNLYLPLVLKNFP
jgi:hypothetical protein